MTENKNDKHNLQPGYNSSTQSMQRNADSPNDKMVIQSQEVEEWDAVITDQRRPQFRATENYGRRNY